MGHHARFGLLHLPVPARDVVAARVAGDVVQGGGFGDVFAGAADDDGEFAFVVALALGQWGDGNGVPGVGDGCAGFEEEGWVGGEVEAGF